MGKSYLDVIIRSEFSPEFLWDYLSREGDEFVSVGMMRK